jgi:hypothetical protein
MNKTIQINQLLIEREDALIALHDIEQQINDLLGQPYPFDLPPALPSRQSRKTASRANSRGAAPLRLRKLDPDTETAYRICYTDQQSTKTEIHTDARPLSLLLNTPLPHITIHRIETVRAADDNQWEQVDQLFEEDSPSDNDSQ